MPNAHFPNRRDCMQRLLLAGLAAGGPSLARAALERPSVLRLPEGLSRDLNAALQSKQGNSDLSDAWTVRRSTYFWQTHARPQGMTLPSDAGKLLLMPALNCFSAYFLNGDHSIRSLGVWPDTGTGTGPRLFFSDNNGGDALRGQAKQEEVMFAVRIQWLPVSLFERMRATVGGTDRQGAPFVSQAMRRRAVLTGFDLRFTNGGHKLQSIGLNNQDSVGSDNWLRWSDSNADDPIRWEASYRLLADGLLPDSD